MAVLSGYLAERLRKAHLSLELASTEIADLQAFNEHVIESLTTGLATTDSEGRLLTFNRAAQAITGYAPAEVIGRRLARILRWPGNFDTALHENLARKRQTDFEMKTGDGRSIVVGLSAAPLLTPRGHAGFLFAFEDVTEVRESERQARAN